MKRKIIVLYHNDCLDGFCAFWVAWKKFGAKASYYAIPPRQFPRDLRTVRDTDIYVLDNSLLVSDITFLQKRGCRVVILDHHISSENDVHFADEYMFDVAHSGAFLTWKHFFPHIRVPWLVRYVEDGDLWNFKIPHTDRVRNMLVLGGFYLKKWDIFSRALEQPQQRKKIIAQGEIIERYRKTLIQQSIQNAYPIRFAGRIVYAVNEATEAIRSEVAHALYKKYPPFSVVWSQEGDVFHVSLRSNGTYDVSKLAQRYGGGGHAAAAGFLVPSCKPFPWRRMKESKKSV
ncbi:MAG: DHHA1 domain-containing protein [Candidatus Paceibacterota bacterium]